MPLSKAVRFNVLKVIPAGVMGRKLSPGHEMLSTMNEFNPVGDIHTGYHLISRHHLYYLFT